MFHQDVGPDSGSVMSAGMGNVPEEDDELDFRPPAVIKGGEVMRPTGSSLSGELGRCFATTSPRSQAVWFPKVTPATHAAWAGDVPNAGLALPDPGPAEQVLAMSPMLYVQIGIKKITMPRLWTVGPVPILLIKAWRIA